MPDRRPYASRGIARRAANRRSIEASSGGALALAVVAILIGGAVIWVANANSTPRFSAVEPTPAAAPVELTMDAAASQSTVTPAQAGPTQQPTQRQWDTHAAGIDVDPALAASLDAALVGVDGRVGIAVKDLGSGRGAVLDGDLELQSASLYKLPVLYTAFAMGLSMNETLPITEDALSYDAGTMELGPGETLTVAEALERMVTLSDNTSAVMLGGRLGAGRINASIASLGMDTTHYSLERMTTSALDMLHLVELIAKGDAVSTSVSADMVHLMLRQRVNDRLPRLLPDDVQVAHKTGNLPGTVNDVGILYGPSTTIAVAALVSDTTDETSAANGIARVARAAYGYFDEQPQVATRPLVPPAPSRPVPPVWRQPRPPTPTPPPTDELPTEQPLLVAPTSTIIVPAALSTPTPPPLPTERPTAQPPPPTATPAPPLPTPTPKPPTATPPAPLPTKVPTRVMAMTPTSVKR